MRTIDLLACKSLQGAELVVGMKAPESPVTGINILEATDIEKWGKPGMVVLTSYFALQSHSQAELELFFEKLKQIGIACIIIKLNRLVSEIPAQFLGFCESFSIPLIRIGETTKYEDIIVDILGSILATREQRLSLYYKVSKISSEMTLEMLSTREILERFKTFLGFDLTLMEKDKRVSISTNPQLAKFNIVKELELFSSEYMTFTYKRYQCQYEHLSEIENPSILLIEFSTNEDTHDVLVIHEKPQQWIDEDDIVVVENLIRCLQLNLLREFSGKQKLLLDKNTMVNDLLRGMINDSSEFDSACSNLGIDPGGNCQVLTIDFTAAEGDDLITLYEVKNRIRAEINKIHRQVVYYVTPRYDQYILSALKQEPLNFEVGKIIDMADRILQDAEFSGTMCYFGGVSDLFPVKEISTAGSQSKSVADFFSQNHIGNVIREYKNLGFFKLFLGKDRSNLTDFVPEELTRLHKESKELFDTLCIYMKNNRNYKQTAEEMFLHPKTVKYRIEKLTKDYKMDLENIHYITILLASIEILEFKKTHPGE